MKHLARIALASVALSLGADLAHAQAPLIQDNIVGKKLRSLDQGELTIATGAITVTGTYHRADTESDGASDDLVTINGGADGQLLILQAANDARTVVVKNSGGNIQGAADVTLDDASDAVALIYDATASAWTIIGAGASGGGGGVTTFVNLTDTPSAFTSQGGNLVRVNSGETALEFVDGSTLFLTTTIGDYTADASPTTSADYLLFHDADAGTWDKILFDDLPGGGGGDTLPVVDTTGIAKGSADATKIVRLEVDGITTGTTRVLTMDDADISLVPGTDFLSATASDYTTDASPTTASDFVIFYDTDAGTWDKVLIDDLPSTGLGNVVEDTTPQLGGNLDANGNHIDFDTGTGLRTSVGDEALMVNFGASPVNFVEVWPGATGQPALFLSDGSDTNVGLRLQAKGTGAVEVNDVLWIDAQAEPATPSSGFLAVYATAGGDLAIKDDGGTVTTLGSGGGGSAITFDIGDDGGNDSTDLTEIATSGDTNSIFTEPTADKMLIDVGQNWPTSDVAVQAQTGDSATAFFSAGTIEHERGGLEADVSAYSGLVKITAGATSAVTVTTAGEAILDDADAAAQRTTLGLVIGTDVQGYDADLADLADGTLTGTKVGTFTGDAGAGGAVGAVPAPAAGDAAANKYLKADGTWSTVAGGGSGSLTTIQEGDTGVGDADIVTLDFNGSDFDLSETPDTEVNVAIAAAITRDSEWDTLAEINAATTDDDAAGLAANNAFTGANDFSGGTLELPQGTTVTLSNTGEIAYDSSGGYGTNGGFFGELGFGTEGLVLMTARGAGAGGSSGKILFGNDADLPSFETPTYLNLGLGVIATRSLIAVTDLADNELIALGNLTSAANKIPYWTGSGTASNLDFLDQDDMSSNSATAVPSQQSVKAYVDAEIAAAGVTLPVADTVSIAEGSVDASKEVRFEVDGITTGTVRVLTMADQDIDLTPTSGSFQASDADLTDLADGTLTGSKVDLATADGDVLDVTYTPTNYTPDATPAEASDVDDLTAHLKGIDTAIGSAGGGGGGLELVETLTASSSTELVFDNLSSAYVKYVWIIEDILPGTDTAKLELEVSTDNGSTWKQGASDYRWAINGRIDAGIGDGQSNADDSIVMTGSGGLGTSSPEDGISGEVFSIRPTGSTTTRFRWNCSFWDNLSRFYVVDGGGVYATAGAVDAVRFIMSAGNIASGKIHLYRLAD